MSKPRCSICFATLMSILSGLTVPLFGFLVMRDASDIVQASHASKNVLSETSQWILAVVVCSFVLFFAKTCNVALFSKVNQNIVRSAREHIYQAVLRKDIGWHEVNCGEAIAQTLA